MSLKPFRIETAAEAVERRTRLVAQLRRSTSPEALLLSSQLEGCAPSDPCLSGACPVCIRALRKALLREAPPHFSRCRTLRVSWIPPRGIIAVGGLANLDLSRFSDAMLRALQRALPPGVIAVGGIDLSLNVENNGVPEWQLHGYVLIGIRAAGVTAQHVASTLRTRLPRCPNAKRAVMISEIDDGSDMLRVLSYAAKAAFYRRSSYRYFRRTTGRLNTNSSSQSLPSDAAIELAVFLDRFPIGDRLLLVGLRRYGRGTNFDLRATAPMSPRWHVRHGEDPSN